MLSSCLCMLLLLVPTGAFHIVGVGRNIASARPSCNAQMAGFGGGGGKSSGKKKTAKSSAPAAAKLSMKRQWDRFQELVGSGQPRHTVYAKITGEEGWTVVGDVACAEGVPVPAAVQLHKRFILEHATRVSPKLALKAKSLECGWGSADGAEPTRLEKTDAADAAGAGFEGAPDPSARYSSVTNLDAVKKMDETGSKMKMGGY